MSGDSIRIGATEVGLSEFPAFAYLITGDLKKALTELKLDPTPFGLGEDREGSKRYAISIGRDSALVVWDRAVPTGWQKGGYAVSDALDAYTPISIDGPDMAKILAECGISDVEDLSPSAAILFADVVSLVIRNQGACEVWIPAAYLTYVSSYLGKIHLD